VRAFELAFFPEAVFVVAELALLELFFAPEVLDAASFRVRLLGAVASRVFSGVWCAEPASAPADGGAPSCDRKAGSTRADAAALKTKAPNTSARAARST
jgi:hypothetical protein